MNDGVIAFVVIVIAVIISSQNVKNRAKKKKEAGKVPYPTPTETVAPVQPESPPAAVRIRHGEQISVQNPQFDTGGNETPGEGNSLYPDEHIMPAETFNLDEPDDDDTVFEPEDIVNGLIMSEILNRKTR